MTAPAGLVSRRSFRRFPSAPDEETAPDGFAVGIVRDGLDRVVSVSDGNGCDMAYSYSEGGMLDSVSDGGGVRLEFLRDGLGSVTGTVDAAGNVKTFDRDFYGKTTHAGGAQTDVRFRYGESGHLSSVSVPSAGTFSGNGDFDVTTWFRDEATGLVTNKVHPDGTSVSYSYTPDGRLSRKISARRIETSYEYDEWDRLSAIRFSDDTPDVVFSRDAAGRLVSAVAVGVQSNGWVYSKPPSNPRATLSPLVASEERQGDFTVAKTVDSAGRTAETVAGTVKTGFRFDSFGRLAGIELSAHGHANGFAYSRPDGSRRISELHSSPGVSWSSSVDGSGSVSSFSNYWASSGSESFIVERDLAHRVSRVDGIRAGSSRVKTFAYDGKSRLVSVGGDGPAWSCAYDDAGNRMQDGDGNGHRRFRFDADGNQLETDGWFLEWDAQNRLSKAMRGNGGAADSGVTISYGYDWAGRMVRRKVEIGGLATEERFIGYDGWHPVHERIAGTNGEFSVDYVWGLDVSGTLDGAGGTGGLLAVFVGETPYYPVADFMGNVVAMVSADGTEVARWEYGPFGEPVSSDGILSDAFRLRFASKWTDPDTGFVYYGMRFYDPESGRWLSRDPIGEYGGPNQYAMLDNSPVNSWDAVGLDANPLDPVSDCERVLADFVKRNDRWMSSLFDISKGSRADMANWTDDKLRRAVLPNNSRCKIGYACKCCSDPTLGGGGSRVIRKEFEISRKIGYDHGDPIYKKENAWVAGMDVTVCSNQGSGKDWEMAFVHELQHALDYCLDDAKSVPECPPQDYACYCALPLCTEMRAFKSMYPEKSDDQIFFDCLVGLNYVKPDDPHCGKVDPGPMTEVGQQKILDAIKTHCNLDSGLVPTADVSYSE